MVDVGCSGGGKNNFGFAADQHGDGPCAPGWSGRAVLVDCDISCHHDAVATVPGGRGHPVEGVDKSIGGSVAGIDAGGS
jgi:hypothetical protein